MARSTQVSLNSVEEDAESLDSGWKRSADRGCVPAGEI